MGAGRFRHFCTLSRGPRENVTGIPVLEDWNLPHNVYGERVPAEVVENLATLDTALLGQVAPVATYSVSVRDEWPVALRDRVIWHHDDGFDRVLTVQGRAASAPGVVGLICAEECVTRRERV